MNTIKFLGTAGARFVVAKQIRSSGGIWFQLGETRFLIDPGPGSLVRCASSRPKLDPGSLDGIILTHRHLDHAADINIMIEAMTEGGFRPKGVVFAPSDALEEDPVILRFLREKVDRIEILEGSSEYSLGETRFRTSPRLKHSVETYGLSFQTEETSISLLPDTAYFEGLENLFLEAYGEYGRFAYLVFKSDFRTAGHLDMGGCIFLKGLLLFVVQAGQKDFLQIEMAACL